MVTNLVYLLPHSIILKITAAMSKPTGNSLAEPLDTLQDRISGVSLQNLDKSSAYVTGLGFARRALLNCRQTMSTCVPSSEWTRKDDDAIKNKFLGEITAA